MLITNNYKLNFVSIKHEDIAIGDVVYIDNFKDGAFPKANPKISGPFTKVVGNGCGRCFQRKLANGRTGSIMHYPEDMLTKVPT